MWCTGVPTQPSPTPMPVTSPTPFPPTPFPVSGPTTANPSVGPSTPISVAPTSSPTPEPTNSPTSTGGGPGCCSWSRCNRCEPTGAYCLASQGNCEGNCGGTWCPLGPGSPVSNPTPRPTNPPTAPTGRPTPSPNERDTCCSWTGCSVCQPTSQYCLASIDQCEGPCNGQWCTRESLTSTSSLKYAAAARVSEDFVQMLCPPTALATTGSFKVEGIATTNGQTRIVGIDIISEANQTSSGRGYLSINSSSDKPSSFTIEVQISTELVRPAEPESTYILVAWLVDASTDVNTPQPWINSNTTE
mmetsp:Transcript_8788/g.17220  ORF Transcript_8788/g.17220 Transcript_8788/m.17220 type:complete len:302 (+) Transcript_8788:1118-2023(+)